MDKRNGLIEDAARERAARLPERRTPLRPTDAPPTLQELQARQVELEALVEEATAARRELETFFDVVPVMVAVASVDGCFKRVNAEWERVLGYSLDEILGLGIADVLHPEDVARSVQEFERHV